MMEEYILHAHEVYLGDYADLVDAYYLYNLQEFTPPTKRYDVIWLQWVACEWMDCFHGLFYVMGHIFYTNELLL